MSSSRRGFSMRAPAAIVDIGCTCGGRRRRRPKLFSSFLSSISANKTPKSTTTHKTPYYPSLSSSTSSNSSSTTVFFSNSDTRAEKPKKKKTGSAAVEEGSVVVEKESSEPYLDFRESIVQMIVENEIYGWDELRELLRHLLSLNATCHHPLILRAFSDVCRAVFSPQMP